MSDSDKKKLNIKDLAQEYKDKLNPQQLQLLKLGFDTLGVTEIKVAKDSDWSVGVTLNAYPLNLTRKETLATLETELKNGLFLENEILGFLTFKAYFIEFDKALAQLPTPERPYKVWAGASPEEKAIYNDNRIKKDIYEKLHYAKAKYFIRAWREDEKAFELFEDECKKILESEGALQLKQYRVGGDFFPKLLLTIATLGILPLLLASYNKYHYDSFNIIVTQTEDGKKLEKLSQETIRLFRSTPLSLPKIKEKEDQEKESDSPGL